MSDLTCWPHASFLKGATPNVISRRSVENARASTVAESEADDQHWIEIPDKSSMIKSPVGFPAAIPYGDHAFQ